MSDIEGRLDLPEHSQVVNCLHERNGTVNSKHYSHVLAAVSSGSFPKEKIGKKLYLLWKPFPEVLQ